MPPLPLLLRVLESMHPKHHLEERGSIGFRSTTRAPRTHGVAPQSLDGMLLISLRQAAQHVNKIHKGRFVLVETVSPAFFLRSLHVAVRDSDGTAAQLCAYNLKGLPEELMPLGTRLVLLEPYFKYPDTKSSGTLFPFLRCDNPQVVACSLP